MLFRMLSSFHIALSGLQAASTRLAVSAGNVANMTARRPLEADGNAPGLYRPQRTIQTSTVGGGTQASTAAIEPAQLAIADPNSPTGQAAVPNVDLGREAVEQIQAELSYKANAAIIRTAWDMEKSLLDMFA